MDTAAYKRRKKLIQAGTPVPLPPFRLMIDVNLTSLENGI